MMIVLERGTTEAQEQEVLEELSRIGLRGRSLDVLEKRVIHVIEGPTRRSLRVLRMERVEALVPTSGPRLRRFGRRFYPYHFVNWCSAALVLLGLLICLSGFFPPGVGAQIEPHGPPAKVVIPWYLQGTRVFRELLPDRSKGLGWLVVFAFAATLFFLPRLAETRARVPAYIASVLGVAACFALMAWGVLR